MSSVLDSSLLIPVATPVPGVIPSSAGTPSPEFVDRRQTGVGRHEGGLERRQFIASKGTGRPEVDELSQAIDQYKLRHRRRFITFEELYDVFASLGYRKPS